MRFPLFVEAVARRAELPADEAATVSRAVAAAGVAVVALLLAALVAVARPAPFRQATMVAPFSPA